IKEESIISYEIVKIIKYLRVKEFEFEILTEVDYAESAIHYLEKTTYDIVFVDIEGGELSGLDLINQWHRKSRDTQWIIVSGYDRFDYAQRAILYGVKEYLLKPITKEKLSQSVERCLKQMNEEKNNFISTDIIENFIDNLEEAVWKLDEHLLT